MNYIIKEYISIYATVNMFKVTGRRTNFICEMLRSMLLVVREVAAAAQSQIAPGC